MEPVALRIAEAVGPMAVVLLAILAGIMFNNSRMDKLDAKIDTLRSETRTQIDTLRSEMYTGFRSIQADLSQFYMILGSHGARLDNLEKKQ